MSAIFFLLVLFFCHSQIIPNPRSLVEKEGFFQFTDRTLIFIPKFTEDFQNAVSFFTDLVSFSTKYTIPVLSEEEIPEHPNVDYIYCTIDKTGDSVSDGEGYHIDVLANGIEIIAKYPIGIFYALQTIRQLLPATLENGGASLADLKVPCCLIDDYPEFHYRGFMLDVSRHFSDAESVLRYIDILAMHKYNTFHWHLTDDQGWRIEIKAFPELTEIGAWRRDVLNLTSTHHHQHHHHHHHHHNSPGNEDVLGSFQSLENDIHVKGREKDWKKTKSNVYGGFYTQAEIKEVVAYAKKRFITVLPEIEMPGHALAALASFAEYSCTGGPFSVGNSWGVFQDVYCVKNETFAFLENVLKEVFTLFPVPSADEYAHSTTTYYPPSARLIHVGGDECPHTRWNVCPRCQATMKENNITTLDGLQSFFIQRMETFIEANGDRSIIGWDEILAGGLAPGATVMSWRGIDGGRDAAAQGHNAVMSPTSHCYFDYSQEPGKTDLPKVYSFDPLPGDATANEKKYIIGGQGNLWREHIVTEKDVEYMMLPRLDALIETLWSPHARRNYDDFIQRLVAPSSGMAARYKALELNYCTVSLPKP